ncbi:MAG: ATP-binding protein [Anaerolineae bacterium]|nr:ATP-binding protein [Anaerolineae bacterium]
MPFFQDLIELIIVPPGDLVYHLVTLFAIQLILGMALGHWNRQRQDPAALRLLVAGVGFTLTRVMLMLIAVLDRVGGLPPVTFLPPFERFLDLTVLLLGVWAFLPLVEKYERASAVLLLLMLLLAVVMYAVLAALWRPLADQGVPYNGYWHETVWAAFSSAALLLALAASLVWRQGEWSLAACLFLLWLCGHALQLFYPYPAESSTAGWVRLANLAALPLVAALVYRRALSAVPVAADTGLEMIGLLGVLRRIETSANVEAELRAAAPSIAHTLNADMVAIGLPLSTPAKKLRIVALHPPTGLALADQELTLLVSRHPVLAEAIRSSQLQRVNAPVRDASVVALYNHLGFERPGPLLAQPLLYDGSLQGMLLAGNVDSQRAWTMRDERLIQAIGAALATALAAPSRHAPAEQTARLQEHLEAAREEIKALNQQLAERMGELERQRQRAEELATRLRLREQAEATKETTRPEVSILEAEIRRLTGAHAELETQLAVWKERAQQLEEQLARAQGRTGADQNMVPLINELRTPVTSLANYASLLLSESVGILGETQRQLLKRIQVNIERLSGALDDLLHAATEGTVQVSGTPELVALQPLIEEVVASLAQQFQEQQVGVRLDLSPGLPPVHIERDSFQQVIRHLLSNACLASQPGTDVQVYVRLEQYRDQASDLPDYLFVSVSDTGGGIAPEDQRRVFNRLYRAENPRIPGLGETGAGLTTAKAIVEMLGGRMWLESEMGVGSTFSFILPLAPDTRPRQEGGDWMAELPVDLLSISYPEEEKE